LSHFLIRIIVPYIEVQIEFYWSVDSGMNFRWYGTLEGNNYNNKLIIVIV